MIKRMYSPHDFEAIQARQRLEELRYRQKIEKEITSEQWRRADTWFYLLLLAGALAVGILAGL